MIKIMNQILGDVSENISYFNKITFNGALVGEIRVSGDTIALGGVIPSEISDLKDLGCNAIIDVFNAYPIILNVLHEEHSILMDGASFFDTLYIPVSSDTVTAKFEMTGSTGTFQTLFCSRANSKNSFTTFITSTGNAMRADFGDTYGSTMFNIANEIMYTYKMKEGLATLNDGQTKIIASGEISPVVPFVIGASFEGYGKTDSYRNFMNNNLYNSFSVMGNDGLYKVYLLPVETNKMVDLVSGRVVINGGTGTATFI